MRCVLLSNPHDMRAYLAPEIARLDGRVPFVDHLDTEVAPDVQLAVAWHPPADAFDHYPNLQAVCSIGAGADSILLCPSLRDGIEVVRVVEPAGKSRHRPTRSLAQTGLHSNSVAGTGAHFITFAPNAPEPSTGPDHSTSTPKRSNVFSACSASHRGMIFACPLRRQDRIP